MGEGPGEALLLLAPAVTGGLDVRSLSLTPPEAFLLSQIDGLTPANVLADLVGMDTTTLVIALQRLEKKGVIRWARRHTDPNKGTRSAEDTQAQQSIASAAADDPALAEVCALSRDERLMILKAEQDFAGQTCWEILGLAGDPTPAEVKRAYFVASKSFHPDRFFGRELGSFKHRLEKIFHQLRTAHETLTDEKKRAAYRAKHPPPRFAKPAAPPCVPGEAPRPETAAEREARLERRRQEIIAERRQKRADKAFAQQPKLQVAQNQKAEEMYRYGLSQLRAGEIYAAVASFKLAITYEPHNEQFRSTFAEANAQAMVMRSAELAEQAATAATQGEAATAAAVYRRAYEMTPQKVELAVRSAEQYLVAGDKEGALQMARSAVETAPQRKEPHVVLAGALELSGETAAALEHLRTAERLDGTDAHVKKAIKRLTGRRG